MCLTRVAREASNGRIRLFATGLGLMPWEETDARLALARESLGTFEHVGLRDEESLALLGDAGAMTGDDAWLGLSPDDMGRVVFADDGCEGLEAYRSRAYVAMQPNRNPLDARQTVAEVTRALLRSGMDAGEDITLVEAIAPDDNFYLGELRVPPGTTGSRGRCPPWSP